MSRGKRKQLSRLVLEANDIIDELYQENKELKNRVMELEASCENLVEIEKNLDRKVAEPEKSKLGIKQRLISFFS
ncbi:hypothetical protein N4T77_02780 [Clostridium sp. CX1]|uniref:hypothetical protein n=1 Tax=Clostridium sp. CX1 TaxID=2978346 RepID=UPI0021C20811|nr:hypothetical protein [Clostridium sp. CX1]MCT8975516.1 hypothetical protein [Clostridium sp. CX1]